MSTYCNLKEAMQRESITQDEMAALLCVHRNTIDGKINGKVDSGFGIEEAFKLQRTFFRKYDIAWLFTRTESLSDTA